MSKNFRAFTLKSNKRLKIIKLQIGVAETSSTGMEPKKDSIITFWAVWDTAATQSCISENVVKKLELEPVSSINIHTGNGVSQKPTYIVDIFLPNNIRVTPVQVTEIKANTYIGFDLIIGMDIISQGDMSISNVNGETMFSFRVPALGAIDFVEQFKKENKKISKTIAAGRNQFCPCGSGKKYKNCCGKIN